MKTKQTGILVVQDFFEFGGATRIIQELIAENTAARFVVLAGLIDGSAAIVQEQRINRYIGFPVRVSRRLASYLSIWWGAFIHGFAVAKDYSVTHIMLNLPMSSLGILVNPLFRTIRKTYIFHGCWDMEQYVSGNTSMPSGDIPVFRMHLSINKKIEYFFMYMIQKFCLDRSDEIIVFSTYARSMVRTYFHIPDGKIHHIRPPLTIPPVGRISAGQKQRIRAKFGVSRTDMLFLLPSRIEPRKGIHLAIDAAKLLESKTRRPFKILITGDTGINAHYVSDCFLQCRNSGMFPRIIFSRALKRQEELYPLYQAADCVLLPSLAFETLGLVTLESLSLGVPVLGFASGATREILSKVDQRLLVKKISADALANAMLWFMKLPSKERYLIGQKAIQGSKQWCAERLPFITV